MNIPKKVLLLLVTLLLISVALISLRWRIEHDTPILLYVTFLIDRYHLIPYKDIFDFNMPGTYFAYYLIGRISGYADLPMRFVDLAILIAMLLMTWFLMKRVDRTAAWGGAALWGLVYLASGPLMSLQREYLILLPMLAAILTYANLSDSKPFWKSALVGFFWGIVAVMKPHAAIGFALHFLLQFWDAWQNNRTISERIRAFLGRFAIPALLGFSLPILVMLWYLWSTHAMDSFLDMARNYWPLYNELTGNFKLISGAERAQYVLINFLYFGGYAFWVVTAATGAYIAFNLSALTEAQKQSMWPLIGFAVLYALYPLIAGKFWPYHWLLFLYFAVQLSALCLVRQPESARKSQQLLSVAILTFSILGALVFDRLNGFTFTWEANLPKGGRVDAIAAYLEQHLHPGDRVQPLDWTGGAVQAMLISEVEIATPFIYDFHFYHHISKPYIQGLRTKFVRELGESHPRFIVQITSEDKPWVSGADTTREFPELEALIAKEYGKVSEGSGYVIYESK